MKQTLRSRKIRIIKTDGALVTKTPDGRILLE